VTKLNSSGTALIYSTYLGGSGLGITGGISGGDQANGIAVDSSGDAYVAGFTYSSDFPATSGAFQTVNHAADGENAFVTKLNPAGTALVYSTYVGGSGGTYGRGDAAKGIAVDTSGDAYVTGVAVSTDFPVTAGAFQTVNDGGAEAFVTKLNPKGTELIYSTFLNALATSIAIDAKGNAYVSGTALEDLPVTADAFQLTDNNALPDGIGNAFLTIFNPAGTAPIYSTYLGGSGAPVQYTDELAGDVGFAIAVDSGGNVYVAGAAASTDFPVTADAFQKVNHAFQGYGQDDAFISKFSFATPTSGINFDKGFAGATGLQLNGTSAISGSRLRLTDGGKFESASAFFETPVNVQSFVTNFTFQLIDPNADGFTFTLQNKSPGALGGFGGALGYAPIGASVAIKFDLHNNAGEGDNSTGLYLSGTEPTYPGNIDLTGTGIDLHSGHIFNGYLSYDGTNLILTINDLQTQAAFTRFFPINIPSVVGGNTAYAGFTAGTGAETATQEILSWGYVLGQP
jgi:hypothetical protein